MQHKISKIYCDKLNNNSENSDVNKVANDKILR